MARAGDNVTIEDLRAAEEAQHLHVGQGDLLFVRVGHSGRREQLGAWDAAHARAGLHPTALEFVAERRIAALGSDGNNDTAPSTVEGVDFPVHMLAINAWEFICWTICSSTTLPRCVSSRTAGRSSA